MGCTSSAPPVLTSDANATERQKSIQFADDCDPETINCNEEIESDEKPHINNVLPLCDTLGETIHLVKSDISLKTIASLEDRICQDIENIKPDCEKEQESIVISLEEDKICTLEEVIEKVLDLNHSDEGNNPKNKDNYSAIENLNDHKKLAEQDNNEDVSESIALNDEQDEFVNEAMSPTQSESSRVTRWEALADIAAELPPSLTIDPITGQIYSLAK